LNKRPADVIGGKWGGQMLFSIYKAKKNIFEKKKKWISLFRK